MKYQCKTCGRIVSARLPHIRTAGKTIVIIFPSRITLKFLISILYSIDSMATSQHELTLCELTEDCDYRFSGRLLFKGYKCWDLKTQTNLLYKRLNIDPKNVTQAIENAKKSIPTIEVLLPPQSGEKVSTRSLKALIEERFSPTSPAYRIIMPEKDEMTKIEYLSKMETWIRVVRISLPSTGFPVS